MATWCPATRESTRRKSRAAATLYWAPYRSAITATVEAMLASGEPPAILSIHSFTPHWRGVARPWKVGVLWDSDPRLPAPLIRALGAEPDIGPDAVGDNEPYEGGLPGDTINAIATARGLANALIELRQDLIGERAAAEAWADRLARIVAPLVAPTATRAPQNWGSRAKGRSRRRAAGLTRRARTAMAGPQNVSQMASNGTWNGQGSQSRRFSLIR